MTPGIKTTEFYFGLAGAIVTLLGLLGVHIDNAGVLTSNLAILIGGCWTAFYVIGRGAMKVQQLRISKESPQQVVHTLATEDYAQIVQAVVTKLTGLIPSAADLATASAAVPAAPAPPAPPVAGTSGL